MKEVKCDDISKRRIENLMNKAQGPDKIDLEQELVIGFARRVGEALAAGITPGMAVTAARKHYRDCAELMLKISNDKVLMSEIERIVPDTTPRPQ
jgi:hypothetical protein